MQTGAAECRQGETEKERVEGEESRKGEKGTAGEGKSMKRKKDERVQTGAADSSKGETEKNGGQGEEGKGGRDDRERKIKGGRGRRQGEQ